MKPNSMSPRGSGRVELRADFELGRRTRNARRDALGALAIIVALAAAGILGATLR